MHHKPLSDWAALGPAGGAYSATTDPIAELSVGLQARWGKRWQTKETTKDRREQKEEIVKKRKVQK